MPLRSDKTLNPQGPARGVGAAVLSRVLATVALASGVLLAGCGGEQSQVAVSANGSTITVLTSDQRADIRPININEGKAIAQKIARGETTVDRLNTEERRQLNAFMKVIRPARASE